MTPAATSHRSALLSQRQAVRRARAGGAAARGMVLVVVMIVIALLALAGFSFADWMLTEHQAARLLGDELQARAAAQSGIEFVRAALDASQFDEPREPAIPRLADPEQLCGVTIARDGGRRVAFSVVAPGSDELSGGGNPPGNNAIHFGLENESAKLNLAAVLEWERALPGAGRDALMALPGMTLETADALLDWIDEDDLSREFGAETSYYGGLDPPYAARNALPESLDELLLVRGITPAALWGLDRNRNGRFEADELAAAGEDRVRTADLAPSGGWSAFLTLASGEANRDRFGRPRIDVNAADLDQLHARLGRELGSPWADFIVAYRQFGPAVGNTVAATRPAPVDLAVPAHFRIASLFDLVDCRVAASAGATAGAAIFASPATVAGEHSQQNLDIVFDRLTTTAEPVLQGRINVELAPVEVLRAVPHLSDEHADAIVAKRAGRQQAAAGDGRHLGWLLAEGVVPLDALRKSGSYLTTGGDIYRAQIVGFFTASPRAVRRALPGPCCRVEAVFDATVRPTRVLSWNDLTMLGRGYSLAALDPFGG